MDHDWILRMLQERIVDRAFLGLIRKWLKAGILEGDGKVINPTTGTPQGGVVSAVLANIYLDYALDLCKAFLRFTGTASGEIQTDSFRGKDPADSLHPIEADDG